MHGDDYKFDSLLECGAVKCAIHLLVLRRTCCLHVQMEMESTSFSETSVISTILYGVTTQTTVIFGEE
jgi:hypothetical protein